MLAADAKLKAAINNVSHALDIGIEKEKLEKTIYQSYIEFKVFTRLSNTVWHDAINIPWESLIDYFKFFGHIFDPITFLKQGRFSMKEKFIFYNMISECLTLDPLRNIELHFDLAKLSAERVLHDQIYLNLDKHYYEQ